MEQFQRSGLTQTVFCRRAQIHLATFSLWRRRSNAASGPAFAEVRLSAPSASVAATLHLASGAKLEVHIGTETTWAGLGLMLKHLQS